MFNQKLNFELHLIRLECNDEYNTHEWMLSRFLFCALPRSFEGGLAEGKDGEEFEAESDQTKNLKQTVDRIQNKTMFGMEGWKYMVINYDRTYPFFTEFVSGHNQYSEPGYELEVEEVYHPNINQSNIKCLQVPRAAGSIQV